MKNKDDIVVQQTFVCSKEGFSKIDDDDTHERKSRAILHRGFYEKCKFHIDVETKQLWGNEVFHKQMP